MKQKFAQKMLVVAALAVVGFGMNANDSLAAMAGSFNPCLNGVCKSGSEELTLDSTWQKVNDGVTYCSSETVSVGKCYKQTIAPASGANANAQQGAPASGANANAQQGAPASGANANAQQGAPASNSSSSPSSTSFENPLQYNTVQEVLGSLLSYLQGIIVLFSLIFIVIGAVLYITSAGNDSRMKTAKAAITASMIGLAIGIAAPSFLKEISTILGWNATPADVSGASSLSTILTNVLTFLTGIVGILALIMLVIGALMYLSAAGDEKRIDEGKKIVKFSIIGIIIAFSALVIVKQIAAFFVG